MKSITARFYDGRTSQKHEALLQLEARQVHVSGETVDRHYPLSLIRVSMRVGNTPRLLYFPDGGQCETDDNDAVDALFAERDDQAAPRLLHRLESRLGYALVALVLTVAALWGFVEYGIPVLAQRVALNLPVTTETALGQDTLELLDAHWLKASKLDKGRRQQLRTVFEQMVADSRDGFKYRLEFRGGGILGTNALALPSGIVLVTDEMVALAKRDEEIIAVLAHEIGHVKGRHTLRHVLQSTATVLLIAVITGDIASATSLAAGIPTFLLEAKYSREFEREADAYALLYMKTHGIAPRHFADILLRMEKDNGADTQDPGFVSSHPATEERTKAFLGDS
ncbi:MAG: M48 family metallopeptidase [Burkholderiales bacterium]